MKLLAALLVGLASSEPAFAQSSPPPASPSISLSSPVDYQVFQRRTQTDGAVEIRGAAIAAGKVEVRILGVSLAGPLPASWTRLPLDPATSHFSAILPTKAGGFYAVEIRATGAHGEATSTTIAHVGVGEVFVVSGQSNSTNYGEVPQKTETRMVTTFDGSTWTIADDPQPGVQDGSRKGSFIPSFGDALYRRYHVPIGIASVGHGSTSVRQWLPAGTPVQVMPTMTRYINKLPDGTLVSDGVLFNVMIQRIRELGPHGFRALLWHQGESDSHQPPEHDIDAPTYTRMMTLLIHEARKQVGWDFPWFIAQATYHTPADPSCPPIRDAQRSLWQSGLALQGPDTDALGPPYRQNGGAGTHFNDAGLQAHGQLWADKVSVYLDSVLQDPPHVGPQSNSRPSPK